VGAGMAIFFHHVGDQNSRRDFPRTIGTADGGTVRFSRQELTRLVKFLSDDAKGDAEKFIRRSFSDSFQIWGIPDGALKSFNRLDPGDYWFLLDSPHYGGGMQYVGKVDYKFSGKQFDLSKELWTESRFPYIFLMHGSMIHFPWEAFIRHFSYKENYDPRGHVLGVGPQRVRDAPTRTEQGFVDYVTKSFPSSGR
jgi:hypothetical protein